MSEDFSVTKKTTMATTVTVTTTEQAEEVPVERMAVLKLRRPKNDKKVAWTPDTVDNEEMNKKKSKCCCVYHKKIPFGESDSEESDDECDHCSGHVEKKVHRRMQKLKELAQTQVDEHQKDSTPSKPCPMDIDDDDGQDDMNEPDNPGL